ncbi:hypothetical protein CVV38_00870 [Candidatus Peregrinibacteria bacterium HGW-Peregrinibacteria-1]|jgi:hypothetical protein|nr:MAG: hypothetical protein CVV38_00870 [Candidatus Peregrinibacteria bacterium HGW-Peregrinibacteria-1]
MELETFGRGVETVSGSVNNIILPEGLVGNMKTTTRSLVEGVFDKDEKELSTEEMELLMTGNPSAVKELLDKGYFFAVKSFMDRKSRWSSEWALWLMEAGHAYAVDWQKCEVGVDGDTDNRLAKEILFNGKQTQTEWLSINLKKFSHVEEEVLMGMCSEQGIEAVLEILGRSEGPRLDFDLFGIFLKLMETGLIDRVRDNGLIERMGAEVAVSLDREQN